MQRNGVVVVYEYHNGKDEMGYKYEELGGIMMEGTKRGKGRLERDGMVWWYTNCEYHTMGDEARVLKTEYGRVMAVVLW